jgi:hypothetical protein
MHASRFNNRAWEGNDEMDAASGRGFALFKNGDLLGQLFFHGGDDSVFKAIKE